MVTTLPILVALNVTCASSLCAECLKTDKPGRKPVVEYSQLGFCGTVIAVGARTLMIRDDRVQPGKRPITYTFYFSDSLAAGGLPKPSPYWKGVRNLASSHLYRAADVRVGDYVDIESSRMDGVDYCDAISISRRPGGRVPPCPGDEDLPAGLRHHDRMQAQQDREEAGGVLPEDRIAPHPRPAFVKIPSATP